MNILLMKRTHESSANSYRVQLCYTFYGRTDTVNLRISMVNGQSHACSMVMAVFQALGRTSCTPVLVLETMNCIFASNSMRLCTRFKPTPMSSELGQGSYKLCSCIQTFNAAIDSLMAPCLHELLAEPALVRARMS
mmetsp:Transcript_31013/g.95968  ORF Transcript_31013/g.95968 Transcript_31013/m.95968 type:complete len:136 (+) Transcript_31013:560-967(+)